MLPKKVNILLWLVLLGAIGLSFSKGNTLRMAVFAVTTDTVKICGSSTTLNTSTVSGFSNPIWNDGSTGTSKTVTASGNYWWQLTGTSVVVNGDFSASSNDRGFTSSYNYKNTQSTCNNCCCGVLSSEGTYAINRNPNNLHTNFTSMGDHTSGSGKMLIVNGSSTANVTVWTENITVLPNTEYVFSVWVASVNPEAPAQLQFSIDGVPLGATITASSTTAVWQYFTTTWNSGSHSGNLPIALVNQNIASGGNDFAVDDIVFAPVYRKNIYVELNPIPVLTLNGPHIACGTYDLTQSIVNYDSATYSYTFKDSHGNIITNVNAMAINRSGVYTIIAQNKLTGCTSAPVQTTVNITPNPQKPGISTL